MLRYMLDTDICIYIIKNRPPEVRKLFNDRSTQIGVSSVTVAELHYGAEKSQRRDQNIPVIESFFAHLEVLPFGENAASHYGDIRADLERRGMLIGPYDLMIAGHARSEGLVVVTNNTREFERVDGLMIENWLSG